MWSSLFPNGFFPSQKIKNRNLESRISSLFKSIKPNAKNTSPVLKELQTRDTVRRLSSYFEDNISRSFNDSQYSINCSHHNLGVSSVNRKTSTAKKSLGFRTPSIAKRLVISVPNIELQLDETSETIISHALLELVESDERFIKSMEFLVENYVKSFENLPAMKMCSSCQMNRQKIDLFGTIERILEIHKKNIHPALVDTCDDVMKFAKCISKLCHDGVFNSYIVFALDEKDCEYRRLNYYKCFFLGIHNKIGKPWNFQPTKQMMTFQKCIIDIRQELQTFGAANEKIEAMIQAQKDFQQVLDKIEAAGKHGM